MHKWLNKYAAALLNSLGLAGLYPCGEGAGYAGGISSSTVDGMRCTEAVPEKPLFRVFLVNSLWQLLCKWQKCNTIFCSYFLILIVFLSTYCV